MAEPFPILPTDSELVVALKRSLNERSALLDAVIEETEKRVETPRYSRPAPTSG
jgi:hypothetical protein